MLDVFTFNKCHIKCVYFPLDFREFGIKLYKGLTRMQCLRLAAVHNDQTETQSMLFQVSEYGVNTDYLDI